jgi:hypothetical protein
MTAERAQQFCENFVLWWQTGPGQARERAMVREIGGDIDTTDDETLAYLQMDALTEMFDLREAWMTH